MSFAISLFFQRGHEWYGILIWRSFSIFFVAPLRKKEKEQMNFQQKWKHRFFIFNLINWILQHFQRHIMESTIAKTFWNYRTRSPGCSWNVCKNLMQISTKTSCLLLKFKPYRFTYTNGNILPQVLIETKAYWTIDWLLLLCRKISSAFVHCPIFNQIQNSFFSFTISKWLKISQSWIKPFFMAKTSQSSSGGLYRLCLNDSKLKYSSIHHFNHLTTVAIS